MTDAEKAALKAQYGNHWFMKVIKAGHEVLIAIPKTKKAEQGEIRMPCDGPVWPVSMLHGTTMRLP